MGVLGSFGDVVFEVSADKVVTFSDFSRSSSTRWADHEMPHAKPKSEWLGPGLDEISFKMRFDARYGYNPRREMEKLLIMCRAGTAATLIIGGGALGVDQWVITAVSQNWTALSGSGGVLVGEADVKLKEYVRW